jgi:hypothetical protein
MWAYAVTKPKAVVVEDKVVRDADVNVSRADKKLSSGRQWRCSSSGPLLGSRLTSPHGRSSNWKTVPPGGGGPIGHNVPQIAN